MPRSVFAEEDSGAPRSRVALRGRHTVSGRTRNRTQSPGQLGHHLPLPPPPRCGWEGPPWQPGPLPPASLMPPLLFLPPVPSFHHPSWTGPGLPDGGEAPSETLQRTFLGLRAVSSPSPGLPSSVWGSRPSASLWVSTRPPGKGAASHHPSLECWAPGGKSSVPEGPRQAPQWPVYEGKRAQGANCRETCASDDVETNQLPGR